MRKALGDIQMKLWGVYDTRIDYEQLYQRGVMSLGMGWQIPRKPLAIMPGNAPPSNPA